MILLLIHLTVADLVVILVGLPLEIAWASTVSWWADEAACKVRATCNTWIVLFAS